MATTTSPAADPTSSDTPIATSTPTGFSTSIRPSSTPTSSFIPTPTPSDSSQTSNRDLDDSDGSRSYYFVFIAVFFICLLIVLWMSRNRRRKRFAENTTVRRSALERDMRNTQFDQLYPNTRRWTGEGRGSHGMRTRSGQVDAPPAEGLDERGEAPPPYVKETGGGQRMDDVGLAIPMQTLQRDQRSKPPDYGAAVGTESGRS